MRKIVYGLIFTFLLAISTASYSAFFSYGPTQENENLYRIALKVRPHPGLTVQQVMIAILHANPRAFTNNNINGLKSGYKLHIPAPQIMARIHPIYALNAVNFQNTHWTRAEATRSTTTKEINRRHKKRTKVQPDQIPSIKQAADKPTRAASNTSASTKVVPAKSSLADLASQQTTSSPEADTASNTATATQSADATKQQTAEINEFIAETKKFEAQASSQLANLTQQNQMLQTKINQIGQELKLVTYRIMQLTQHNASKGQGAALIDNLRKNAIGLASGVLALILFTYLLARSFRKKSKKTVNAKEDMSVSSKLDLARAYIDMGDQASARSVLQEVMTSGNEEQRKGASDLLAKLNQPQ